ncbi:hypothetical protein B0T20DRAFT_481723 [Sordaria brevicollis]|uniref:Uncharacterized protein n=1 Tax=Sordaria brevicollis TaxID=83679 RepID=A0AAE0U8X7_SORBR|nr:hypothetical protein B0T20DRAFT_481723 [Sordaria brevicollis]
MAPRAANVGSDESALAGAHAAAPPQGQHHPEAQAPGRVPARAGAAAEEEEDVGDDEDDDEMVSVRMYHQFLRESVRPGNSRRSEASAAAAHELPAAPPTQPVESTEESTAASSYLPATPSSRSGATPSWEVEGEGDILDETPQVEEARAVQLVRAQATVVEVRADGQGQAGEEEDGEEVDDDERSGEIEGVHPVRDTDSVGDEVVGNGDRKGKEGQAAEVLAAQAVPDAARAVVPEQDQGRNQRRFGRAEFTPGETRAVRRMGRVFSPEEIESVQSSLQPPGPSEAAESPSDSPPPSLPAPSETEATAEAEAPIVPSSGSSSASVDTPRLPCGPSSEESTREPRC